MMAILVLVSQVCTFLLSETGNDIKRHRHTQWQVGWSLLAAEGARLHACRGFGNGYARFVATRMAHRTLNQSFPSSSRQTLFPPSFRVPIASAIRLRARVASSADWAALAIQSSTSWS